MTESWKTRIIKLKVTLIVVDVLETFSEWSGNVGEGFDITGTNAIIHTAKLLWSIRIIKRVLETIEDFSQWVFCEKTNQKHVELIWNIFPEDYYHYYYYYFLRVLHIGVSCGFFTWDWVITNLMKSPGLFSVFWPISIML